MNTYKYIDIKSILNNYEYKVKGDVGGIAFDSIASKNCKSNTSIDWCAYREPNKVQEYINNSLSKLILVDDCCYNDVKNENKVLVFINNPKLAVSEIASVLFSKQDFIPYLNNENNIHQDAEIAENVIIGKNSIIGNSKIGENVILYGNNYIFNNVEIGKNVIIHPGAVIGGAGFGFIKDKFSNPKRFAHIGKVTIGNNVEVGANTVIDRGGLGDTIIDDYTKIDSMVHIGHNVRIGKNCSICSNTTISGSVTIGDNVWISPNSVIKEHLTIVDNSFIGMGSVVVNSILRSKKVFGNPAKELRF